MRPCRVGKQCGGGAFGTTIIARQLGADAGFIGGLGKYGENNVITNKLEAEGVNFILSKCNGETGRTLVLVPEDGERTLVHNSNIIFNRPDEGELFDFIKKYSYLYTDGYSLDSDSPLKFFALSTMKKAKKLGTKCVLDLADVSMVNKNRKELVYILKKYVDIVSANEEEAKALRLGDEITTLCKLGEFCETVILRKGENGSFIKSHKDIYYVPSVNTKVLDTTGAGDIYNATFLCALSKGNHVKTAAEIATKAASKAISNIGCELLPNEIVSIREEIERNGSQDKRHLIKKGNTAEGKSAVTYSLCTIGLKVTRQCNLDCVFCCEPIENDGYSLESIKKTIDEIAKLNVSQINLTGGEPFLRSDLGEIVKYIDEKKIASVVFTNGTLVGKKLEGIKPVREVRVSVHGLEKTHDSLVGKKGAFLEAVEGIKKLINEDIPVSVTIVVQKKNIKEVEKLVSFLNALGVKKAYLFNVLTSWRGKELVKGDKQCTIPKLEKLFNSLQYRKAINNWQIKTCLYTWRKNGECILIYPSGLMAAEPYDGNENNRAIIGNIFENPIEELYKKYEFKQNALYHFLGSKSERVV